MTTATPPPCRCCGKPRRRRTGQPGLKGANGFCEACNDRWHAAGCPPEGPPPPVTHAERAARSARAQREARERRVRDYAWSRSLGLSIAQAAADAGVSDFTARYRYEPLLQQGQSTTTEREGAAA